MSTAEFMGETFELNDKPGTMAAMRFARTNRRVQSGQLKGQQAQLDLMSSILDMVEEVLAPSERDRFEDHATEHGADLDDLMGFMSDATEVLQDRPSVRSSDLSDGPRTIVPFSTDDSSSEESEIDQVIARHNQNGRPDLALLVRRRGEALTA